jgi:hypothetical protein
LLDVYRFHFGSFLSKGRYVSAPFLTLLHRRVSLGQETASAAISQEPLRNQDDTAGPIQFPNVSEQFDVTQKTVMTAARPERGP